MVRESGWAEVVLELELALVARLEGVVALLLEGVAELVMVPPVLAEVQEVEVEEPVLGLAQAGEPVVGAGEPVGVVEQVAVAVQAGAPVAELVGEAPS